MRPGYILIEFLWREEELQRGRKKRNKKILNVRQLQQREEW